jgi:hypothetical protein
VIGSFDHWEVAARISSGQPRIVFAVVPRSDDVVRTRAELETDLRKLGAAEVRNVVAENAQVLEATLVAASMVTLVTGLDALTGEAWRTLDRARSRLRVSSVVALVTDEATARRMAAAAPNLASWVADSIYRIQATEPIAKVPDERLAQFSTLYKMSAAQAIRRAENREAPSTEPDFALWLILLGRGDLVLRGKDADPP